jgi:hypothetical protein
MSEYEIEIPGVGTLRVEQDWVDVSAPEDLPGRNLVPGRVGYFLNDQPISEDEYRRLTGR